MDNLKRPTTLRRIIGILILWHIIPIFTVLTYLLAPYSVADYTIFNAIINGYIVNLIFLLILSVVALAFWLID